MVCDSKYFEATYTKWSFFWLFYHIIHPYVVFFLCAVDDHGIHGEMKVSIHLNNNKRAILMYIIFVFSRMMHSKLRLLLSKQTKKKKIFLDTSNRILIKSMDQRGIVSLEAILGHLWHTNRSILYFSTSERLPFAYTRHKYNGTLWILENQRDRRSIVYRK